MAQGRFSRWNPGEDMGMSDPTWGGGKLGATATNSIMNVVRDNTPKLSEVRKSYVDTFNNLISPGTRDLRKDIRSLGHGVSDYTKKYVTDPEGWKDLGKEIIDVIATPVDTAAALASGMATSVAAPYAALPTLLRSDDPLTREGSKEWIDKMHSVAESIPTYHARTRFGKKLTEGIGNAWEQWNNEVAAKVGVGIENALKFVGVDYKAAERAGALTSGVVGAAPALVSALRVRGESTSLPVSGYGSASIRNSRINQLANIADPNFMSRLWMQVDPVGFAKAKADGTLNKKLSDMGWEFTDHIENIPVVKEELGKWKKNEASGDWEYHSGGLGEFRPAGKDSIHGSPEEIALDPTAIDLHKEAVASGTARHEMHHALDRHAYKKLKPETPKSFNEWLDEQSPDFIREFEEAGDFGALIDIYDSLVDEKRPYGYLSEELPSVNRLANEIMDQQTQNIVSSRQAEAAGTLLGEDPSGWYPPPPEGLNPEYWSFDIWEKGIRDELKSTTDYVELSARLDGLQRFLKANDLGVSDIFTKHEHLGPGNWKAIRNPKLKGAPNDVQQLVQYLNDLVGDKYGQLQRLETDGILPGEPGFIDVERVGQNAGYLSTSNTNRLKALHDGRMGASVKYVMGMLTEAIADTKITFPKKYKIGFAK